MHYSNYYFNGWETVWRAAFVPWVVPNKVLGFMRTAMDHQKHGYKRVFSSRETWHPKVHYLRYWHAGKEEVVRGSVDETIQEFIADTKSDWFETSSQNERSVQTMQYIMYLLGDLTNPFHIMPVNQEYAGRITTHFKDDVCRALEFNLIPFTYKHEPDQYITELDKGALMQYVAAMEGYQGMILPHYVHGNGYPCCMPAIEDWFNYSYTFATNILMGVLHEASDMDWGS